VPLVEVPDRKLVSARKIVISARFEVIRSAVLIAEKFCESNYFIELLKGENASKFIMPVNIKYWSKLNFILDDNFKL